MFNTILLALGLIPHMPLTREELVSFFNTLPAVIDYTATDRAVLDLMLYRQDKVTPGYIVCRAEDQIGFTEAFTEGQFKTFVDIAFRMNSDELAIAQEVYPHSGSNGLHL